MAYKKCGFREELRACNFKEDKCNAIDCDFHKLDFYDLQALHSELGKILPKLMKLLPKLKRYSGCPVPEHLKPKVAEMQDLAYGAKTLKEAVEWHNNRNI